MRISLQDYDLELKYISGKEIKVADQLSRAYLKEIDLRNDEKVRAFVGMVEKSLNIVDTRIEELKEKTGNVKR